MYKELRLNGCWLGKGNEVTLKSNLVIIFRIRYSLSSRRNFMEAPLQGGNVPGTGVPSLPIDVDISTANA
jgi:hypothetical protein